MVGKGAGVGQTNFDSPGERGSFKLEWFIFVALNWEQMNGQFQTLDKHIWYCHGKILHEHSLLA